MGEQIIRQPDGRLAVFSSVVDSWTVINATPEGILDYYINRAAEDARTRVSRILDAVLTDEPHRAYSKFAMTFELADDRSFQITGKRWRDAAQEFG